MHFLGVRNAESSSGKVGPGGESELHHLCAVTTENAFLHNASFSTGLKKNEAAVGISALTNFESCMK